MCRLHNLSHRPHEGMLHHVCNIAARVPLARLGEGGIIVRGEVRFSIADGDLEHAGPAGGVGQTDVDAALEAAADGRVELPGDICGTEHEDALAVLAYAVHLHEELGLDAPRGLRVAFAAGGAEGVDFVDEDDGRFVLARHGEEEFYKPVAGTYYQQCH